MHKIAFLLVCGFILGQVVSAEEDPIPKTSFEGIVALFADNIAEPLTFSWLHGASNTREIYIKKEIGSREWVLFGWHGNKWIGFRMISKNDIKLGRVSLEFHEIPQPKKEQEEQAEKYWNELVEGLGKVPAPAVFDRGPESTFYKREGGTAKRLCSCKTSLIVEPGVHRERYEKLMNMLLFGEGGGEVREGG